MLQRFASWGQWLGFLALIVGIVVLTIEHEKSGTILISISSLFYATVTKIKYYKSRKKQHKKIPLASLYRRNPPGTPRLVAAISSVKGE